MKGIGSAIAGFARNWAVISKLPLAGLQAAVLLAFGVSLSACGSTGTVTEKEFVTVNVPVRGPCPDAETKARVDAARPVPLRSQPRPATEEAAKVAERVQLGRYEAPNGWADQAQAVMDSCANP